MNYKLHKLAKGICNTITKKELVFRIKDSPPQVKTKLIEKHERKKDISQKTQMPQRIRW